MPENTPPVNPIIEQAASVIAKTELDMPWADLVRQCPDDADWYRNAARALADAGLLRTEPAVHPADVPQPGDRVQVTWRRTGTSRESVVDERGYYEGKSAVLMYPDTVTVEVIEPAPAADVQCCYAGRAAYPDPCPWHPADTGTPAPDTDHSYTVTPAHEALYRLLRDYETDDAADGMDMANEFLRTWTVRPADTGKETDR